MGNRIKNSEPQFKSPKIQDLGQDCAKILVEQQNVWLKNKSIARENAMTWILSQSEFILARAFLLLFLRKKK